MLRSKTSQVHVKLVRNLFRTSFLSASGQRSALITGRGRAHGATSAAAVFEDRPKQCVARDEDLHRPGSGR
eukprot:7457403-Alexandrium_andersonii.AAC.1